MKECCVRFNLPFVAHPYQLRHTGASMDIATGDRQLQAVKKRGRWSADASVKRYEWSAHVTRVLYMIPEPARTLCIESAQFLPSVCSGARAPKCPEF